MEAAGETFGLEELLRFGPVDGHATNESPRGGDAGLNRRAMTMGIFVRR
jgi:hypothetical protein